MDRFGNNGEENGQAENDDFGDMDDDVFGDDDFGDMDDDVFGGEDEESSVDELEHRVDEVEAEVGRISSTVGTIESENEVIRESVEETEENVRKLLEVYEMVTRGVNPFVDDDQGGAFDGAGGGGGGGFGLFDEEDEEEGDIDEGLAGADAESFFDDDFDDAEEEGEEDLMANEVTEEDDAIEEEFGEDEEGMDPFGEGGDDLLEDAEASTDSNGGDGESGESEGNGTDFDDLKAEYEAGGEGFEEDAPIEADEKEKGESEGGDGIEDGSSSIEGSRTEEDTTEEEASTRPAPAPSGSSAGGRAKPYLRDISGGYTADPIVLEWLGYLVENADGEDAVRAIGYYEAIEWISADVGEQLRAFLAGFAGVETTDPTEDGPRTLGIDHHMRSLAYVSLLASDGLEAELIDRWSAMAGADRDPCSELGPDQSLHPDRTGTGVQDGDRDGL